MEKNAMLQSSKNMLGYRLEAKDGEIGKVHDFFFDDHQWVIRYAVVDTARWLPGRKVLLAPESCDETDGSARVMRVDLTQQQIKDSPGINTDKPVSRQEEEKLRDYFGWTGYWSAGIAPMIPPYMPPQPQKQSDAEMAVDSGIDDHHLRSLREVEGYRIHAVDGDIGHLVDLIADDQDWRLRYMVIDTGHWLPGRKVLIPLEWAQRISWADKQVMVDVTRQAVEDSPRFHPEEPINREYETMLYDFYGRPRYWLGARQGT
jgi:hypothetical protein